MLSDTLQSSTASPSFGDLVVPGRNVVRFATSPSARRPDTGVFAALGIARVGGVNPAFSNMFFSAEKSTAANAERESARSRAGNDSVMRSPEEGDFRASVPSRRVASEPARRDPGVATAFAARIVALDRGIAARTTCAGSVLCRTDSPRQATTHQHPTFPFQRPNLTGAVLGSDFFQFSIPGDAARVSDDPPPRWGGHFFTAPIPWIKCLSYNERNYTCKNFPKSPRACL